MINGSIAQFAGKLVTIRGSFINRGTGRVSYLVEFPDGTFSRAGAESLAPLEPAPYQKSKVRALTSMAVGFLRQGVKRKAAPK